MEMHTSSTQGRRTPPIGGAGGEDGEVSGGWPPEGSGAAGAGAGWGAVGGGRGSQGVQGPSAPK
jgi:hypothetical protein